MFGNKRGLLGLIIIVVVLVVGGFFLFWDANKNEFLYGNETFNCAEDSDCVLMQTTCCPCESGGVEKCVSKSEVGDYEEKLLECPADLICAEIYNCKIESCSCVDGNCTEVLIE